MTDTKAYKVRWECPISRWLDQTSSDIMLHAADMKVKQSDDGVYPKRIEDIRKAEYPLLQST